MFFLWHWNNLWDPPGIVTLVEWKKTSPYLQLVTFFCALCSGLVFFLLKTQELGLSVRSEWYRMSLLYLGVLIHCVLIGWLSKCPFHGSLLTIEFIIIKLQDKFWWSIIYSIIHVFFVLCFSIYHEIGPYEIAAVGILQLFLCRLCGLDEIHWNIHIYVYIYTFFHLESRQRGRTSSMIWFKSIYYYTFVRLPYFRLPTPPENETFQTVSKQSP